MAERKGNKVLSVQDIISLSNARLMSREEARRELGFVDEETKTVAEEPKLKIGDTIEGAAAFNALPAGAIVASGSQLLMRTVSGWASSLGCTYGAQDAPEIARELVYLP